MSNRDDPAALDPRTADTTALLRIMQRLETAVFRCEQSVKQLEDGHEAAAHERQLKAMAEEIAQQQLHNSLEELRSAVAELRGAFPDNDPRAHRACHDEEIERRQAAKKRRDDITTEILKKGAWALVALIAWALWELLQIKLKQG